MPLDNQDELFYLVDENDQELGSITRRQAHDGTHKIHRAVSVVLSNEKDQILLQKRSLEKDMFPGFWTISASGHVTYGQSYEEAALREMQEELGISTALTFVKKYMVTTPGETEYDSLFTGDIPTETEILFDTDEVSEVKWFDPDEIKDMVNQLSPFAIRSLYELKYLRY